MILRKLNVAASWVAKRLCAYRGRWLADAIEKSVGEFHMRLNNVDFDMAHNGELRVLRILSKFDPKCIFDVGAHKGDWCRMASSVCPGSTIHAFEVVPSTCLELKKNINDLQNVIANDFGLSSEGGTASISIGRDVLVATGCKTEGIPSINEYYDRQIQCRTRKACDYLKEQAIGSVDLLKIDVEGTELQVIKGFGEQIKNVRAVQFEYGVFNIASRDLLIDFYRYFKDNGFVVGKIFPRSVNFFEYHFLMENFHGSNYLAVRQEEKGLIRELSRFGILKT